MMKKSLIALAVIAASGAAMAQSSVTLYGVADAGIGRNKYDDGPNAKTRVTTGAEKVNNGSSRVGFTGVEDLGNGNKVGFQFETGLNLDTGDSNTGGPFGGFWGRQANVFVGGNWGTIKAGRQFTVSHIVEGSYELTGVANYSAVDNTYKAGAGITNRAPAAIAYISPNMGGFTAAVAFVSKNNTGLAKNVWDAGLIYSNGPIAAGLSVNKGLDGGKTNYQLGAKYNFGNFAVAASYHNATSDNDLYTGADGVDALGNPKELVRRGFSLGGSATFGAFTVTLDVTRDTKNEWITDPVTGNYKKYTNGVLEGKYALSKRTFLYADFLRQDGTNNWGLGIHHSF